MGGYIHFNHKNGNVHEMLQNLGRPSFQPALWEMLGIRIQDC